MSGLHARLFETACALAHAKFLDEVGRDALPLVANAFGCSGASIYRISGDRYTCISPFGAIPIDSYVRHYMADDPVHEVKVRLDPSLAVTTALVDRRRFERSAVYNDFYRRHDWEHTLFIRLSEGPYDIENASGLTLTRPRTSAGWSSHELDLASRLAPLFRDACRSSRAAPEDRTAQVGLDLDGCILWRTPAARLLLEERGLRDQVVGVARRVGSAYVRRSEERLPRLCLRLDGVPPVQVDLVIAMSPRGSPYVLALLEREDASLPRGFSDHYGITPAEARVLGELARGRSNREIGRRLSISVNTVRTHLVRLFEKLQVGSRTEALVVLRSWTFGA